jgi:hypothetical protein
MVRPIRCHEESEQMELTAVHEPSQSTVDIGDSPHH